MLKQIFPKVQTGQPKEETEKGLVTLESHIHSMMKLAIAVLWCIS